MEGRGKGGRWEEAPHITVGLGQDFRVLGFWVLGLGVSWQDCLGLAKPWQ